ncbi:MAG: serine hydrolase domain-containing protein [Pseudomonadota bacterium]
MSQAEDLIDAFADAHVPPGAPGFQVCVMQRGEIVLDQAFGLAQVELDVQLTADTRIPIGSVTKPMTALAALRAEEMGLCCLDDPIRCWLPELPELSGYPTLRQLLWHTGGYRDYLDCAFADGFTLKPAGEVMAFHQRQTDVNFAPGTAQLYSNSGYYLVSLALEAATGTSFAELLNTHIFQPAGMPSSELEANDWPVLSNLASGYIPVEGGWRPGVNVGQDRKGDGGVIGTASDLCRFLWHLRDHPASLRTMLDGPNLPGSAYGLGLQQFEDGAAYGHGGNVMGASSFAVAARDTALDVAVIANNAALPVAQLGRDLLTALGGPDLPSPKIVNPSATQCFVSPEHGGWLEVGDGAASLYGGPFVNLDEDTLRAPTTLARILPDGEPVWETAGLRFALEPTQAKEWPLDDLVGLRFRSDPADTDLSILPDGNGFRLDSRGGWSRNRFAVRGVARDVMIARHGEMPFTFVLHLRRDDQGVPVGLDYASPRTWRLPFERVA